jgi:hypothetical protein
MVDIQTISIAIASAGVFLAAVYYIFQLRHQSRVRQTDLAMRLYSTWGDESLQKACATVVGLKFEDYDDYVKKYGASVPVLMDLFRVGWFFNGIGVLLQSKLADIELVDKLFGYMVISLWEILKPIIEGMKKQSEQPRSLEWFEYLYDEMKKRERQLAKT